MTYFEDLSPYTYWKLVAGASYEEFRGGYQELLSIGWLDASHDYTTGPTPASFQAALLKLCAEGIVARTRGYHQCNLPPCDERDDWPPESMEVGGRKVSFGSAEIRVAAGDGIGFAAPNLIYHYVVEHGYKPPNQFVEAVQRLD